MDLAGLSSHSVTRFGLPGLVFLSIWKAFKILEGNTSKKAQSDLSLFIRSERYENYIGMLPDIIQNGFDKLIGTRHLSLKCIRRSFVLSVASSTLAVVFSLLYNYHDAVNSFSGYSPLIDHFRDAFLKDPRISYIALRLERLEHRNVVLVLLPCLWISWCFIPDFIALLKTRVVLLVLKYTNPSASSLFVIFLVDFTLSIVLFFISLVAFQVFLGYFIFSYDYGPGLSIILPFIFGGLLFTVKFAVFVFSGSILFSIPLANIFWASALPSVWVWIYVFAALITRLLLVSRPVFRNLVYVLDFEEKPISSLGLLSGSIAGIITVLFILFTSIAGHT